MAKWPSSAQYTLERNFSDHCPILLRSKSVDWGPKPFRIMDCWLFSMSFKKAVEESWTSNQQSGWGGYVLKEKIKALKNRLRVWNIADRQLSHSEMLIRKQLQEELWVAAQSHELLLRQKARSIWIKEGDCNSRYFHLMINASRWNNCLKGMLIDGVWSEELATVKEAIRLFFEKHFQETKVVDLHWMGYASRP